MRTWMREDWAFEITVLSGRADDCRLGLEEGDVFRFQYGCPGNFCPRAMIEVFTWCEVVRYGGDFTYRGSSSRHEMDFLCPCRSIKFRLRAIPVNRDENGNYIESGMRPDES